jgi:hypothetical protein
MSGPNFWADPKKFKKIYFQAGFVTGVSGISFGLSQLIFGLALNLE